MRDEFYSQTWADQHGDFSREVSRGLLALRQAAGRLLSWDGSTTHLIALIASLAITGLSFNTTAV